MANQWLRLWHDMPNDPKWRTISRQSGQPISLVLAIYTHLLVDASRNVTRGHVNVTQEDLASALDVTEAEIDAVLIAMDGRVIENGYLLGWEKRQPKREDQGDTESGAKSAAERKRGQRERQKKDQSSESVTQCHDESRNVTLDKDKDKDKNNTSTRVADDVETPFDLWWKHYPKKVGKGSAVKVWKKLTGHRELAEQIIKALHWQKRLDQWTKDGGQYIPNPDTYLRQERWLDEPPDTAQPAAPKMTPEEYAAKRKAEAEAARERMRQEQWGQS